MLPRVPHFEVIGFEINIVFVLFFFFLLFEAQNIGL
jgi:hypothetical protein